MNLLLILALTGLSYTVGEMIYNFINNITLP